MKRRLLGAALAAALFASGSPRSVRAQEAPAPGAIRACPIDLDRDDERDFHDLLGAGHPSYLERFPGERWGMGGLLALIEDILMDLGFDPEIDLAQPLDETNASWGALAAEPTTYTVQGKNDTTLPEIAQITGTTDAELQAANPTVVSSPIPVGTTIVLPGGAGTLPPVMPPVTPIPVLASSGQALPQTGPVHLVPLPPASAALATAGNTTKIGAPTSLPTANLPTANLPTANLPNVAPGPKPTALNWLPSAAPAPSAAPSQPTPGQPAPSLPASAPAPTSLAGLVGAPASAPSTPANPAASGLAPGYAVGTVLGGAPAASPSTGTGWTPGTSVATGTASTPPAYTPPVSAPPAYAPPSPYAVGTVLGAGSPPPAPAYVPPAYTAGPAPTGYAPAPLPNFAPGSVVAPPAPTGAPGGSQNPGGGIAALGQLLQGIAGGQGGSNPGYGSSSAATGYYGPSGSGGSGGSSGGSGSGSVPSSGGTPGNWSGGAGASSDPGQKQLPQWLQPIMQRALAADGLPADWITSEGLYQVLQHESGFKPSAQNPTSTAYGLFQFLNSTWKTVGGTKTSDPYLQCVYGLRYMKARYGTPDKAWAFWQAHKWW